ncbi:MAG TPA: CoB--CoM heterodisulfide reductase iron-sulfur subunit B family protein [Anaerolineales bacterium]|nr:CoB--CoM heterodisulfide reductase iron-sulfur subunit B family protein [Anaerolineales bacterium]
MKQYAYYPGCSLESLAKDYQRSTKEVAQALDLELKEIEDWNCCGATAYFPVDELLAYTLVARNLAIAEKMGLSDFVAPCSACYKNAYFTNAYLKKDPDLADHINFALEEDHLHVEGTLRVRHLIEVFLEDVGLGTIKDKTTHPLTGLRVAPYYGCQLLRPRKDHEEVENPQYFEQLLSAIGAQPLVYDSKTRCCGGSLIITNRKAALEMVRILLKDAIDHGADVIATTCPMCNVNLEVYQDQVNREFGTQYSIPVMYFTQLMGMALGIPSRRLGITKELVPRAQLSIPS